MRRAAKIDKNQPEIVASLRKMPGITVEVNHDDILLGFRGKTYWFEIKSDRAVSKRTGKVLDSALKKSQKRLKTEWTGHYSVVSGIDEILRDIGACR